MPILHLVSHTHWDREWYLTFQQFRLRLVHLVDRLLDIFETERGYRHFMLDGQTVVLEDYLQIRPEREAELRAHIRSGRIGIGPWYILPDEFLVSPESLIRNLLEGDRICQDFGMKMPVGYIPDTFGHIGQLPQIVRGFGMETAAVWRGIEDVPNQFWWQAPDGSRVLTAYLRGGYGNAAGILAGGVERFAQEAARLRDELAPHSASPHLLLMHGVDHQEPDPATARAVAVANVRLEGDRVLHSTLAEYFAAAAASLPLEILPVVQGELRASRSSPLLPGVLSARMWIKQRNAASETLLEKWAEPFSAWAEALQSRNGALSIPQNYVRGPAAVLRHAWRMLLLCHPHDSICGCSIDPVHEEMRPRFDQVDQIGKAIMAQSLQLLAEQVVTDTLGDAAAALVVFNPGSGPRTELVSAVIESLPDGSDFALIDGNGLSVPFQITGDASSASTFNIAMGRQEFMDMIGFISGGVVMGQVILDTQVHREGDTVFVTTLLGQQGKPNIAAWDAGRKALDEHLLDSAVQTIQVRASSAGATHLVFPAREVPARGYQVYAVRARISEPQAAPKLNALTRRLLPLAARAAGSPLVQAMLARFDQNPASKPPYQIENEFFVVTTAADGTLDVMDRRTGAMYSGWNRFIDGGDRGDTYNYSPPEVDARVNAVRESVRVERGAAVQTLTIHYAMSLPLELSSDRKQRSNKRVTLSIVSTVSLAAGVPRIDIATVVENNARDHRLRVHFPAPFAVAQAQHDGHFHLTTRPVGPPAFDSSWIEQPRTEVPQRAFTAVHDDRLALVIANRGLPEVEVLRQADGSTEVALTLLRCVGWLSRDDFPERKGHAGPGEATPGAQMPGSWQFAYAAVPGRSQDLPALYTLAADFSAPMHSVVTSLHAGSLPQSGSFLQVEPAEFAVTTVKQAESSPGWIVRGYNRSDEPRDLEISSLWPVRRARRVNLLEKPVEDCAVEGGRVRLHARPWEIISVLLET